MISSFESKVERKTFAARADLLDRLSKVASEKGYSLYALVNEIFEVFLSFEEEGIKFKDVLEGFEVVKRAREGGFVLQFEGLVYEMVELAFKYAESEAVKKWFDSGVWFARRWLAKKHVERVSWRDFAKDVKTLFWNVEELEVDEAGGKVSISVLSPRFSEAYTILFASFLEGCLAALGYRSTSKEVFRGKIFIEAVKVK